MSKQFNRISTIFIGLTLSFSSLALVNADTKHHQDHHHQKMEIPAGQPVPSVDLIVHKDKKKGWNLEAKVTNFRFAPESINNKSLPGEGHAHLYINGQKITRLYSSWYYLENLKPGENKITVSLNANSHEQLVHNGKMITDTEIIDVPKESKHQH
jgi:hypothetical protein